MGDSLHYWDYPEGSDQYICRRQKALHPGRDEEAIRIYQTYWKPLLEKSPQGPTLVTNTYKQDMEDWVNTETAESTQTNCVEQVATSLEDRGETVDTGAHHEQKMRGLVDMEKQHVAAVQSLFDDEEDDDDDCAYGISLCMTF